MVKMAISSAAGRRLLRRLSAASLLMLAGACAPIIEDRGYILNPDDLEKLQPGFSTQDEVRQVMGSPSTVATVDGEAWYYISSRIKTVAFYPPEEIERTVVAIYFDENKIMDDVGYYGLADGQDIAFVSRRTETRGKELTLLGQIFGNIGRFNNSGKDSGPALPDRKRR